MNNFEKPQETDFRSLVGSMIEASTLFPSKTIAPDKELTILDAIENNEVELYVSENASDKMLDAINCLIDLYDELKKDTSDSDFISRTVLQLKEYL